MSQPPLGNLFKSSVNIHKSKNCLLFFTRTIFIIQLASCPGMLKTGISKRVSDQILIKMKKIQLLCLFFIVSFQSLLFAQIDPCLSITKEVIAPTQSGAHNYFGVKITLSQTYDENITVTGYIYDGGDPNVNHPYELTIAAGDLSVQTSYYFYETSPTSDADVNFSGIYPLYVTHSGQIYTTHGECTEFSEGVKTLSETYIEAAEGTVNFSESAFSSIDMEDFYEYLVANGVSATASHYSVSSNDVQTFKDKCLAAWEAFWDIVEAKYGSVSSITSEQLQGVLDLNGDAFAASRQPQPNEGHVGCMVGALGCQSFARSDRRDRDHNCMTTGGGTPNGVLFNGLICLLNSSATYNIQMGVCTAGYYSCIGL